MTIYHSHFYSLLNEKSKKGITTHKDDSMIIAQVSIAPVGVGVDLSTYVKKAVQILKNETERCETNAMATVVETETIQQLFNAVNHAHSEVLTMPNVQRVITEIKIDHRRDKNATIDSKIQAATNKEQ